MGNMTLLKGVAMMIMEAKIQMATQVNRQEWVRLKILDKLGRVLT